MYYHPFIAVYSISTGLMLLSYIVLYDDMFVFYIGDIFLVNLVIYSIFTVKQRVTFKSCIN